MHQVKSCGKSRNSLFYSYMMGCVMFEYKVVTYKVSEAEKGMNILAREGWKVIAVSPNIAMGYGIIVTYERQI